MAIIEQEFYYPITTIHQCKKMKKLAESWIKIIQNPKTVQSQVQPRSKPHNIVVQFMSKELWHSTEDSTAQIQQSATNRATILIPCSAPGAYS